MDIRRKRGLLWCLGLVAVLLIWQAKASDRVVPVGLELSNNNINAFAYDDEGYMWMGTSRGLNLVARERQCARLVDGSGQSVMDWNRWRAGLL